MSMQLKLKKLLKIHDENGIPRIVLGDWGDNLWYIKSSNGEIELLQEKI